MKRCTLQIMWIVLSLVLLTACGAEAQVQTHPKTATVGETPETTFFEETQPAIPTEESVAMTETVSISDAEPTEIEEVTAGTEISEASKFTDYYGIVLEQYLQAAAMDSEEFITLYWNSMDALYLEITGQPQNETLQTVESVFPYVNRLMLYYHHQYDSEWDFVFTLRDIDGNGIEELLVGRGGTECASIVGLYTLDGQVPVTLEKGTGERAHLNICTDGTICLDVSEGASYHRNEYYRMDESGSQMELIQEFYTDYHSPEVEKVLEAIKSFEEKLTIMDDWHWQPLI